MAARWAATDIMPKKTGKSSTKRPAKAAATRPISESKASGAGRPRQDAPVLRPLPVFEFTAGGIMGYLRLADPDRGFEFCRGVGGGLLPMACKEVLSLRHYLARGAGGLLAPREEAECKGKADKTGVLFRYQAPSRWPIEATARYELLGAGGLDATFAFDFAKDIAGFEAGVETLVPRTHAGVHVHAGGRWMPTAVGPKLKRFYPRNLGAAELIADGRWNGLRRAGIGLNVEPQGYDYPMIIAWEPSSDTALAWMALTEECSSMWVNGADRTVGMALGGASVRAGTSLTCRVRILMCRISQLDDALPHYRDFVQDARSTRRR